MNKLYRSLLLTGSFAAALAGCGDDVTITEPPPPPPPPVAQVRQVSVAPDGVTVSPGQTLQMTAAVTADAGCNATTTWSTTDATRASVSASGLVTVAASAASGPVAIRATATCAAGGATGNGVATLNVVGTTVTAVTVTPATATINAGTSLSAPQTLQASAAVSGTNSPAQTVSWSSLDATLATVSAAGVVTANNTGLGGNVVIKACSTVDTSICGTAAVTVVVPSPASVQIQAVTFNNGTNNVPVNLTNVKGQIEISLNVEAGSRNITRVDALVGGQVVATQTFASASAAAAPEAAATTIILSTNTAQVRSNGGIFVPVIYNGNSAITANLYVSGSSTPLASNAIPVVMNNPDAVIRRGTGTRPATLAPTSTTPSAVSTNDGETYYTGTQDVTGYDYVAFGKAVPDEVLLDSNECGWSESLVPAGASATGGIALGGIYDCGGAEGGNDVEENVSTDYATGAVGPDGTPLVAPENSSCSLVSAGAAISSSNGVSTVGSAFQVGGENRWNMICPPVGPAPGTSYIDNVAPSVSIDNVAFNDLFDQQWVNASYAFAQDLNATDNGVGLAATSPQARDYVGATTCSATVVTTGNDYAETLTSSNGAVNSADWGKQICTYAADQLGNEATSGGSNYFGIDKVAASVRFAGETAATPLLVGGVAAAATSAPGVVSNVANTTIFSIAAVAPGVGPMPVGAAQGLWGLEGIDTRSGFNQNAVTGYPAQQSLSVLAASGTTACGFTNPMSTILSDNYVRTVVLPGLDCGFGAAGYFTYNGSVTDRAGNVTAAPTRNFAVDQYAIPAITGLGFAQALYTGGQPASFGISANDDLELIDGTLALYYDDNNDNVTDFTVRYPAGALSPLGTRWDGTLTNILNGASLTISSLIGRLDTTLTATNLPNPSSLAYSSATNSSPDSVAANVSDVAGQAAVAPIKVGMLTTQFAGTSQPWTTASAGTFTDANSIWRASTVGGNIVAEQKTGTSVTTTYFDRVDLYGVVGGELVFCATYPAPVLTGNGIFRTWTYTTPIPVAPNACATAVNYRTVGMKGAAALMTQQH